jgi:uncharacterized membrane protein
MKQHRSYFELASEVIAVGGLVHLLDLDRDGRRRRVLLRDKAVRVEHMASQFADKAVRDLRNRLRGILAESWATTAKTKPPDEKLVQRVRSRLGRAVSHPHALTVEACDGVVVLRGPILEHEVQRLIHTVRSVSGVRSIDNGLEPHKTSDSVPALQGTSRRPGSEVDFLQQNWAPATRVMGGLGAVGLLSVAVRSRPLRLPLGIAGSALLLRALINMPLKRALGFDPTPRVIVLQKTVNLQAPLEEVYRLFAHPENFPRIFEHVKDVRHSRERLYHWTVAGPGGVSISWEAEITQNIPNRLVAWRSVPGAAVRNAGFAKFQRNPDGSTAVHMQFAYNPPAGVIGHAIASLFGADPKHELEDDLGRLKSLFETGKTTVHHHRITREELEREITCKEC